MGNNFELDEMKQQWSTLQSSLRNQKELNIKYILKDVKNRNSKNNNYLVFMFFMMLFFCVPVYLYLCGKWGISQPITVTTISMLVIYAFNSLYMSLIVKTPNDGNVDILKYSKSLVKFKRHYLWSEMVFTVVVILIVAWTIVSKGVDFTDTSVIGMSVVVTVIVLISAVIGILLDVKMLNNIKEISNDIHMIEDLRE